MSGNAKLSSINRKITSNKTKHLLVENGLKELKKLSEKSALVMCYIFITTSRFDGGDGFQDYLIFQPVHRYIKIITNTKYISEWKSKGLSDESIKPPPTSDNSLTPLIDYYGYNIRVKFNGSILRQPRVSYTHEKIVNIYIVYELAGSSSHSDDPALKNCLFGAVTLTKNADIDKYGYSGYGIGFDRKSSFSFPGGGFGQNVLIFGADMSSSPHINNKKSHVSPWKRTNTGIRTHINCRKNVLNYITRKIFCLSLHYNGANSYLLVNGKEIVKFKAKYSAIVATSL